MTDPVLRPWSEELEPEITAFVADHPDGLIYYSPSFRRYLLAVAGGECRSVVAYEDGRLTGLLPVLMKTGPYGSILNSLPFFGSNGGVLTTTAAASRALTAEYDRIAADAAVATWISHPFAEVASPKHDLVDERIAQWTDLGAGADFVLRNHVEASARRNIQKAEAAGVTVGEAPEALDFLQQVHGENMAAIDGRPKPPAFFSALRAAMEYGRDWRLYLAQRSGESLAALLTFEGSGTIEYVMPVVTASARSLQPTAALLATAMRDGAARGFRRWNWGGTWLTQEGVYRFKKKWGARERRYHYYVTLNDRSLLQRTAAELAAAYPWYYTVPYHVLTSAEPASAR